MSIWQSHNWKNLLLTSHQAQNVFEVDWIFVEKRSIWLWKYWLFALWIWENQKINEEKLIELCKLQNCLFIQLETFGVDEKINLELKSFKSWYYKKFITPYTAIIDVSKTEEEILASMKPKWRYNINLASKKWVEVFIAEKTQENIKIFYDLMRQTTKRDWFSGNTLKYYKNFLENIPESTLIFTKFEDKILSAWIFIFDTKISIYYYWASTSDKNYRNLMAPYLMQWFAIQKAKKVWSKFYDFLGVATPGEKNSNLAWVTDFKLKFTSDVRKVSESYIFINKKCLYVLFWILKKIKSKI
jgi:lipid II:glycine glycyltransferase (peptidoglycan interpeptide bridge formation enzyme)